MLERWPQAWAEAQACCPRWPWKPPLAGQCELAPLPLRVPRLGAAAAAWVRSRAPPLLHWEPLPAAAALPLTAAAFQQPAAVAAPAEPLAPASVSAAAAALTRLWPGRPADRSAASGLQLGAVWQQRALPAAAWSAASGHRGHHPPAGAAAFACRLPFAVAATRQGGRMQGLGRHASAPRSGPCETDDVIQVCEDASCSIHTSYQHINMLGVWDGRALIPV